MNQGRKFNVERNHGKNARGGALLAVTKERASRQELKIKIVAINERIEYNQFFYHPWLVKSSKPIEIPNKLNKPDEPIFNNHFHCFSDNDFLLINSPPQNNISNYFSPSNTISNTISNLKNSMKYFSI